MVLLCSRLRYLAQADLVVSSTRLGFALRSCLVRHSRCFRPLARHQRPPLLPAAVVCKTASFLDTTGLGAWICRVDTGLSEGPDW